MKDRQSIRAFFKHQLVIFSLAPVILVVTLIIYFFIGEELKQISRVAYWQARNVSIELKQELSRLENQLLKEADIDFLAMSLAKPGLAADTIRQLQKTVKESSQIDAAIVLDLSGHIEEAYPFSWYAQGKTFNFLSDFYHVNDFNKASAAFFLKKLDTNGPDLSSKSREFASSFEPSVIIVAPLVKQQNSFTYPHVVVGQIVFVVSLKSLIEGFKYTGSTQKTMSNLEVKFQQQSVIDFEPARQKWLYVSETDSSLQILDRLKNSYPLLISIHEPLLNHIKTINAALGIVIFIVLIFMFFIFQLTRKLKLKIGLPISEIISDCVDISNGSYHESQKDSEFQEFITIKSALSKLDKTIQSQISNVNEQKQRAENSEKAKSLFLANMSHEIRTPISGIIGMLQLVKQSQLTAEQTRRIDLAKSNAEALITIINDILDFSKIESGKLTIDNSPFNLIHLLNSVVEIFAHKASGKGIKLTLDISNINAQYVEGDETRIRQILFNIVGNAIKFTETGCVSIECDITQLTDSRCVMRCVIQDTGIGMTADQCNKIFEDFVQANSSTTRKFGGTGLGLSISKKLVEQMNGTLALESQPNIGSRFVVTIPLLLVDTRRQQQIEESSKKVLVDNYESMDRPLDGKNILLAEDNTVNQEIAQGLLEALGAKVDCADNGRMTIAALLAKKDYDLILMDCLMPELDGFETTLAIRKGLAGKNYVAIPIIALTANAFAEDRLKCLNAGMNDFLTKPIDESKLLQKIIHSFSENSMTANSLVDISNENNDISSVDIRWDKAGALKRVNGNYERLAKLITLFIDDIESRTKYIEKDVLLDAIEISHMAHVIKSTAAAMCANKLTEVAVNLELAAKEGDVERCKSLMEILLEEKIALVKIFMAELEKKTHAQDTLSDI